MNDQIKSSNEKRKGILNANKLMDLKVMRKREIPAKKGCKDFFVFQFCQYPNPEKRAYDNENQGTSRQMTVSMDTQNLNVYDGILQSGSPSLTVWTTYNTRGEKTFGIDITEYVISFIER